MIAVCSQTPLSTVLNKLPLIWSNFCVILALNSKSCLFFATRSKTRSRQKGDLCRFVKAYVKVLIFFVVMSCCLTSSSWCFEGSECLHLRGLRSSRSVTAWPWKRRHYGRWTRRDRNCFTLKMKALGCLETSWSTCLKNERHSPKNLNAQQQRWHNFKLEGGGRGGEGGKKLQWLDNTWVIQVP